MNNPFTTHGRWSLPRAMSCRTVSPSRIGASFGRTARKAHAGGAAVISSGNGGVREVSGEHALYLPRIGVPEIMQAVDRLSANPAERDSLATEGHARALAKFDIRTAAEAHDKVLEALIFQTETTKSSDLG